jgi:3-oxoacyl-[acyl-carrier protein] reductase
MSASTQPLAGKIALITGASKGIGAATALELSSLGAKVVINYSSDSAPADELVKRIGSDNAIAIKADAGSVQEIEALVKQTVEKWGRIDILIPNAGIAPMKDLESTTEEDFDAVYRLNVKGVYFLVQVS